MDVPRQNNDLSLNRGDEVSTRYVCHGAKRFSFCAVEDLACFGFPVFRSLRDLLLENLALRQQLVVLKQRLPQLRSEMPCIMQLAGSHRVFISNPSAKKNALIAIKSQIVG
jgi:hypothetical protein